MVMTIRMGRRVGLLRAALFGALLIAGAACAGDDTTRPTAAQARTAYDTGTQFVDVRTDAEWTDGHLKTALHLPLDQVESQASSVLPDKTAPLMLYCASGKRAQAAADELHQLGYTHVVAMTGGYKDLKAAGYPVVE